MNEPNESVVLVRRQWNDWRTAEYRLSDVEGVHWSRVSGGVGALAPQPFMNGYVRCDQTLGGELAHSRTHGPCPHSIKVCIVKKDNTSGIIQQLERLAGHKPK